MEDKIKLTEFSRGAGCGCKIAPAVLEQLLGKNQTPPDSRLLVGNDTRDDAAVYDLGDGKALISTTDFFMPIVDDAFSFGKIAAANAISDVYAMGGKPILAIAILGWPVDKIGNEYAARVLEGARVKCREAGITVAGGHSIDATEPFFGLAVNGLIDIGDLKKNNTAKAGDWLLLTKPLGSGILSTAQKRGVLTDDHLGGMIETMEKLNTVGEALGKVKGVHAMTDVTGFGLLGHCMEVAQGSGLSAEIYYDRLKTLPGAIDYLKDRIVPDATYRNWNNYSSNTAFEGGVDVMQAFSLLPDPQTNGGLLIAVDDTYLPEVQRLLVSFDLAEHTFPIGRLIEAQAKTVTVKNA
ncbi:selenide, water dikinase SelD [Polluticoccus soli]|uniref:selenide, water dikinase SelD n=1 Tax=Polluticoccus soli TaxID=3034150 RepID=UPI0023E28E2A|nr:selenide, water dikinase SelD [Flavipsychrobacter sp. JY13-12]